MARQLKVSILLESIADTKGFQRFNQEMRATQLALKKLGPALDAIKFGAKTTAAAVGIAGGALAAAGKMALDYAAKTNDMANATGVSTDAIQSLGFVARNNGANIEDMSKALVQLQASAADAAKGNDAAREKFARLGISAEMFARLRPEEQMDRFARAVAGSKDKQEALAAAMDIVGAKNAPKLMASLIELGEKGFGTVAKEAAAAGQIMSGRVVADLDRAGDKIEELKTRATIAFGEWAGGVLDIGKALSSSEVEAALKKRAELVERFGKGSKSAAEAGLELAEAYIKAGNIAGARFAVKDANVSGALAGNGNPTFNAYLAKRNTAVIAAIREAAKQQEEAEKKVAAQSIADAAEAERVRQDTISAEQAKGIEERAKNFIRAEETNTKLAAAVVEARNKKELEARERHQDAISAIVNREVNDYQRRGLQLGAMRDPFSMPAFTATPPVALPTILAPNNAGREDVKIVPQILRSIDATLKGIERKDQALA